jgi:hypothetical protein
MIERCRNAKHPKAARYVGRGIRVCDRWLGHDGFLAFLADVGRRPSPKHSLDRIDNNGHYEPGNVRWATKIEQARNTSANNLVTAFGETLTQAAWAERFGLDWHTIRGRLAYGWPAERAVSDPAMTRAESGRRSAEERSKTYEPTATCPSGHLMTGSNVRIEPRSGHRRCRTCERARCAKYDARQR